MYECRDAIKSKASSQTLNSLLLRSLCLNGESELFPNPPMQGLNFTINRLAVPTKKAHLLLDFAHSKGKQHDFHEHLFRAYFAEGRNVNTVEVLSDVLKESGLDVEEALRVLEDKASTEK